MPWYASDWHALAIGGIHGIEGVSFRLRVYIRHGVMAIGYRSHAEYPSDENLRRRCGHARAPTWYHYRVLRFAHHAAILPRAPSCTRSAMQSWQWLPQHSGQVLHPLRLVRCCGAAPPCRAAIRRRRTAITIVCHKRRKSEEEESGKEAGESDF